MSIKIGDAGDKVFGHTLGLTPFTELKPKLTGT
jgi:hypothetical protein